ncbi:Glutaredoxin [Oceanobacillus limi]|uniref:Glutaredoxin n=1 Tax=Oceanobacillus limi TaxID=930131 RepID=A0A1I0EUT9_9BACI|nr:glutaredoxin family protein [Oceanobacillus limi]SET48381.1 Glutaredoxin [Oceanobacillus limi]
MDEKITLYTTTMCPVCSMVRNFLTNMDLEYKEINVDLHPVTLIKLIGKTRRFSVPQTNINGEWIFGFDPVRMLEVVHLKSN